MCVWGGGVTGVGEYQLSRYVGHWSVQKLGVGGSEGKEEGSPAADAAVGGGALHPRTGALLHAHFSFKQVAPATFLCER